MRRIRLLAAGVLVLAGGWATAVPPRIPVDEIFKNRSGVLYLGGVRPAADFRQRKQAEALVLKQELEAQCKLPFRVITTRYFNLAYRCPENEIRTLAHYLERFFHDIYPRYFRYEPRAPFRVVYFRTQREFYEMTGSDAYGFYRADRRTMYTWARSGHGTLWHEMIHAFVHDNVAADPQQWFNEGLASFYEMAFLKNERVDEGYSNWRMPALKAALARGKVPPLKTFLLEQRMGIDFGYAHARFFFCYLWTKNRLVPFVRGYLYDLLPRYRGEALGRAAVRLAERLLGYPIEKINADYLALVRRTGANQKLVR